MIILDTSDPEIVSKAALLMRRGDIAVFPTDTVYGLGTIATKQNNKNVQKIFKIKKRSLEKPLSVLMTLDMISQFIEAPGSVINSLREIWPAPITFIVDWKMSGLKKLSPYLNTSGNNTIACRVPAHDILLSIIRNIEAPIVGTSANTSGHEPSINFSEVFNDLSTRGVDLWIDQGILPQRSPSTIIDITSPDEPIILRKGDFKLTNFRS
ncbi:threonylcarbamoyl-AMP synthase [Candidatus Heimdallarchaeota archaeon B3_Heim]|nr:MAG: threonylcarbamoyl-AMP synthase [Candidatus Heimdallarchaeota archaeon B3_Heim]